MSNKQKKSGKDLISILLAKPHESLVIHYSRQNLEDNEGGVATPRIVAIIIKSLDGRLSESFAIHFEAEKNEVLPEEISNYYDSLEERLIKAFILFVKKYRNCHWLHWDMNDVHFSFEAIEHRYKVLTDTDGNGFINVPLDKRININTLLQNIYGDNYEKEPMLDNLLKSNSNGNLREDYLSLSQEGLAFQNANYSKILESLRCKVNFLIEAINKAAVNNLKVSNKNIISRLGDFISHPITSLITFIMTVLGLIIGLISILNKI